MDDGLRLDQILVPIDGSENARDAAQQAVRLARTCASTVTFLHVVSDAVVAELAQREIDDGERRAHDRLVEQGRAYLRDVARLAEQSAVPHREVVGDGDPCAVICETAAGIGADLVVMGKIGHQGARRILVGSIARRVIETCDRPVLIVPIAPPAAETGPR
ncbi:MAG TPA: universal stress protein [Candidatus Dormibacteraeota bacterium]|nr:universal stress protein [Candidatus Dormibacteraeota bacterium]